MNKTSDGFINLPLKMVCFIVNFLWNLIQLQIKRKISGLYLIHRLGVVPNYSTLGSGFKPNFSILTMSTAITLKSSTTVPQTR